jgi:hypothetical protein
MDSNPPPHQPGCARKHPALRACAAFTLSDIRGRLILDTARLGWPADHPPADEQALPGGHAVAVTGQQVSEHFPVQVTHGYPMADTAQPGGLTTMPSAVALALFAAIGTSAVAKRGFDRKGTG